MADKIVYNHASAIVMKLPSADFQDIKLLCNLKEESAKLKNDISTLKAILVDAQQQEQEQHVTNNQAIDWLQSLKDVVEDADDLLDDFSTEDLLLKVHNIPSSSSNHLSFCVEMRSKVEAIRKRLDDIAKPRIKFHFTIVEHPIDKRDKSYSFVRVEQIIGRNDDKKSIVEYLMNDKVEENVSVIAIVGIGGVGKTALAQLVFNDKEVKKNFELKMWVCVSDIFDVKQVAEKIIKSASGTMEQVQNELREKIDGNKYLLVLDDVWNDDRVKWIELIDLLMGGGRGSKILITTRTKLVATASGVDSPYLLGSLSDEESWSLFEKMAFKKGKKLQNACLVEIGKKIVKKCAGVPLAIKVLGSLLYTKDTVYEWLNFQNKDMAKIAEEENIILPMLKLSYDHLHWDLKQCFAFCRLYPKNHVIDKQQLIQLWVAHGFIRPSNKKQDMEDVGDLHFINLLRRSFFQDEIVDEFGNIISCKMHDLMHDLAVLVAGSESFMVNLNVEDVSPRIRHMSFDCHISVDRLCEISAPLCGATKTRTFFLPAQSIPISMPNSNICEQENPVYATIFSNFKKLHVLDLHALKMGTMPSCISKLNYLRYLDLSWNRGIKTLPNSITMLVNLRTLKLLGCWKLNELPADIKKLVSLRHLEFDYENNLTCLPVGLGQLTSLRTLSRFIVDRCNKLKELKDLNNLRGDLSIELPVGQSCLERPRLKEAEEANLKEKKYLQSLKFNFGDYDDGELKSVLEALQPHTNMKKLEIEKYGGLKLPKWMSSLSNLVEITLRECKGCKHLPKIEQLSRLRSLVLEELHSVEYIDDDRCGVNESSSSSPSSSRETTTTTTFFPSLKYLTLWGMPNLMGWWSNQAEAPQPSFPGLVESKIEYCPKLTSMPLQPTVVTLRLKEVSEKLVQQQLSSSLVPLSNLKKLEISGIKDLVTLPEEAFRLLTSLMKLAIFECPRLTSLSGGMRHLTALTSLHISKCQELDLSDGDDDGMHFQGLIKLTSLEISSIPKLESLPAVLQHVTTLQSLSIERCENLKSLPEWTGNLTSLQILDIDRCPRLKSLPEGMRRLTALETLTIKDCSEELKDRCQRETGEDWPKIAHIPKLDIVSMEDYKDSEELKDRCQRETGEDWPKIDHIPELEFDDYKDCSEKLKYGCPRGTGEDWPKIDHIPELEIDENMSYLHGFFRFISSDF